MDAKTKLKSLIEGEASINDVLITDGQYADEKRVYNVSGNVAVYRDRKPKENFPPIDILHKMNKDAVFVYIPSNGRETQRN